MDLSRAVYSRDQKIAAMCALGQAHGIGEIARKYESLERWRGDGAPKEN